MSTHKYVTHKSLFQMDNKLKVDKFLTWLKHLNSARRQTILFGAVETLGPADQPRPDRSRNRLREARRHNQTIHTEQGVTSCHQEKCDTKQGIRLQSTIPRSQTTTNSGFNPKKTDLLILKSYPTRAEAFLFRASKTFFSV